MLTPIEIDVAKPLLEAALCGEEYLGVEAWSWWSLYLSNDLTLLVQEFTFSREQVWSKGVAAPPFSAMDGVDPEFVPWAMQVFRLLRREIVAVSIDEEAALTLTFDGGEDLTCRTDTDIVDWQWALSLDKHDPYAEGALMACYSAGTIDADLKHEFWRKGAAE